MTWKLATDAAKDYPTTKALIKFADEVYEKSNGRIAVDVYESSILVMRFLIWSSSRQVLLT